MPEMEFTYTVRVRASKPESTVTREEEDVMEEIRDMLRDAKKTRIRPYGRTYGDAWEVTSWTVIEQDVPRERNVSPPREGEMSMKATGQSAMFDRVTRFEVVDEQGRAYVRYNASVQVQLQDDMRTLKVFVQEKEK